MHLLRDLEAAARKRSISVETLIEQILSTAMFHELFITDDDQKTIDNVYKKYIKKEFN
jgi:hypothetical protein